MGKPIYSHLGPRGNCDGRIHMCDGRVRYCDASWQPWAHRRSDELSRFTCQRFGRNADLDSLLYQTQGGTHEPSESVKWRRDSLQALSHAGIGSLERRGKKEGVQIKRQRCFFSPLLQMQKEERRFEADLAVWIIKIYRYVYYFVK